MSDSNEEFNEQRPPTPFEKVVNKIACIFVSPVEFVRNKLVLPNQKHSEWYHQKFRRVPEIDECCEDDKVCFYEANYQYKRDRQVDSSILHILRQRFEDCVQYETPDHVEKCEKHLKDYEKARDNWFIKYGDLGGYHDVLKCYMKQKHRMLWERRYGKIGGGDGDDDDDDDGSNKEKICKEYY